MKTRKVIAVVLAVLAMPILLLGLIDPLEGGIALLGAIALAIVVRLLSRVRIPKLAWISMLATVAVGVITIVIAITAVPPAGRSGQVMSPISGATILLLWVYRVGVVVTLVGAVIYLVRLFRSLRTPVQAQS
jgi:hypothetical protein